MSKCVYIYKDQEFDSKSKLKKALLADIQNLIGKTEGEKSPSFTNDNVEGVINNLNGEPISSAAFSNKPILEVYQFFADKSDLSDEESVFYNNLANALANSGLDMSDLSGMTVDDFLNNYPESFSIKQTKTMTSEALKIVVDNLKEKRFSSFNIGGFYGAENIDFKGKSLDELETLYGEKLDDYIKSLEEQSKLKDNVQSRIEAESISTVTFDGVNITTSELLDYLDGAKYFVMRNIMSGLKPSTNSLDFEKIYSSTKESILAHLRAKINSPFATDALKEKLNNHIEELFNNEKNYLKFVNIQKNSLKQFKAETTKDLFEEIESSRENTFDSVAFEFDTKDMLPPIIKMYIASVPYSKTGANDVVVDLKNTSGFKVLGDFGVKYNTIAKILANTPSDINLMMEKLNNFYIDESISDNFSFIRELYLDLKSKLDDLKQGKNVKDNVDFLVKFTQSFSKHTPQFYIHNLSNTGDKAIQSQTVMRHKTRMKREILSNIQALFKSDNSDALVKQDLLNALSKASKDLSALRLENGDKIAYYKKLKDIMSELGLDLNGLNIASLDSDLLKNLSDNDRVTYDHQIINGSLFGYNAKEQSDSFASNVGALQFKVLPALISHIYNRASSTATIGNSGNIDYKPLASLLSRNIEEKGDAVMIATLKYFDKFIDSHYNSTSQTPDNQFLSASGETNYGIVLNHQISDSINEINTFAQGPNAKTRRVNLFKKAPKFQSATLQSNKILNSVLNNGFEIEIAYQNGIASGDDGKLLKDMDIVEKWYTTLDFVHNDYFILPRAADRSVENVFRIKNGNGSTVSIFDKSEPSYQLEMKNILAQEIFDILNIKRNLNSMPNISNFNENMVAHIKSENYTNALVMFNTHSGKLSPETFKELNTLIKNLSTNTSLENIKVELDKNMTKIKSELSDYLKKEVEMTYNKIEASGALLSLDNNKRPIGIPSAIWNEKTKDIDTSKSDDNNIKDIVKSILKDHIVKSELSMYHVNSLFLGNINYFKNADDYFKRVKPFNGTKKNSIDFKELNDAMNNGNYIKLEDGTTINTSNAKQHKDKLISIINGENTFTIKEVGDYFDPDRLLNESYDGKLRAIALNDVDVFAGFLLIPGMNAKQSKDLLESMVSIEKKGNTYSVNDGAIDFKKLPDFVTYLIDELYSKDGITNKYRLATKAKSFLAAYTTMKEMDGESYMTLPAYKETLVRAESWTENQEILYKKLMTNQPLTLEDAQKAATYFRKLKTLGTGHLDIESAKMAQTDPKEDSYDPDLLFTPVMYKHSIQPLIPQLVGKDSVLGKLTSYMMSKGYRMAVYDSANKVGSVLNDSNKRVDMYDVVDSKPNSVMSQVVPYNILGIQVELKPVMKEKSTVGSQLRKLILSNMYSNGKPTDYKGNTKTWNALSDNDKKAQSEIHRMAEEYITTQTSLYQKHIDDLLEEFDIKFDGSKYTMSQDSVKKITDILTQMGSDRGYSENVLQTMQRFADPGITLEYLSDPNRIEPVLYAIINNRIVKEKRHGIGAPQAAVTGWEIGKRDITLSNNKALKFYRLNHDQSKILPAEVYYQLPGGFNTLKYLNKYYKTLNNVDTDYSVETLMDLINADLDAVHQLLYKQEENGETVEFTDFQKSLIKLSEIVGFRIPTQGLNSADSFRIRKFLNPIGGDSLVVPSEIVAKAGSDFDIDKMTLYLPSFKWTDKGITFDNFDTDMSEDAKQKRYDAYVSSMSLTPKEQQIVLDKLNDKLKTTNAFMDLKTLRNKLRADGQLLKISKKLNGLYKNLKNQLDDLQFKTITRYLNDFDELMSGKDTNNLDFALLEKSLDDLADLSEYYSELYTTGIDGSNNPIAQVYELAKDAIDQINNLTALDENKAAFEELKKLKSEAIIDTLMYRDNFYSKAEYDKLPLEAVNSKKQLEDRMLDIHKNLLASKHNYRLLLSPITDDIFKDKEIGAVWDIRFMQSKSSELVHFYKKKAQFLVDNSLVLKNGSPVKGTVEVKNNLVVVNGVPLSSYELKEMDDATKSKYELMVHNEYQLAKKNFIKNYEKASDPSNAFKTRTNIDKFVAFLSGQAGVGQAAVHVTHHQLAVAVDLKLNRYPTTFIFPHNTSEDNLPSLGKTHDVEGNLISETLSGVVNSYVDVAKDPYIFDLNAGNDNANLQFMLMRMGVPYGWISKFLSQPAIKAYQKQVRQYRNALTKGKAFESGNKLYLRAMYELTGDESFINITDDQGNVKNLLKDKFIKGTDIEMHMRKLGVGFGRGKEFYEDAAAFLENAGVTLEILNDQSLQSPEQRRLIGELLPYLSFFIKNNNTAGDISKFSETGLEFQLGNFNPKNKNDVDMQKNILAFYLQYQDLSKELQLLMRATNADTKGTGKNRNSVRQGDLNRIKVEGGGLFDNSWKDIFKKTIVKKPYEAVSKVAKLYDEKMLFESNPGLKSFRLKVITTLKSGNTYLSEDAENKILATMRNLFITHMDKHKNPDFYKNTFESLVIKSPSNKYFIKNKPVTMPQFISIILTSKAKDLPKMFIGNPAGLAMAKELRNNRFIRELKVTLANKSAKNFEDFNHQYYSIPGVDLFDRLDFNRQNIDAATSSVYISELNKLRDSYPDFYKDLLSYARVMNGFGSSNNTFNGLMNEEDWTNIKREAIDYYLGESHDTFESEFNNIYEFLTESKNIGDKIFEGFISYQKSYDGEYGGSTFVTTTKAKSYRTKDAFFMSVPVRVNTSTVSYVSLRFIPDVEIRDGETRKDFAVAHRLLDIAMNRKRNTGFEEEYDVDSEMEHGSKKSFAMDRKDFDNFIKKNKKNFLPVRKLSSNYASLTTENTIIPSTNNKDVDDDLVIVGTRRPVGKHGYTVVEAKTFNDMIADNKSDVLVIDLTENIKKDSVYKKQIEPKLNQETGSNKYFVSKDQSKLYKLNGKGATSSDFKNDLKNDAVVNSNTDADLENEALSLIESAKNDSCNK